MKEFSPRGQRVQGHGARVTVSFVGLERDSSGGGGGGQRVPWERSAGVRWLG